MKVNKIYPGQPNYTGPNEGWFIFIHHSAILEYSDNIQERITYIQHNKPKHEQATRLACLTYVKPSLAVKLEEAKQAHDTAWQAYHIAWQAYRIALRAFHIAWQVYRIALQAYHTAWQAHDIAWQAYKTTWLKKHFPRQAKSWDAKNKTLIYK